MTDRPTTNCLLAAPILGEQGGGVGQVSALLWDVMQDTWAESSQLVTLLRNGHARPRTTDKIRFGIAVAGRRWRSATSWTLFSHLGLTRVDGYLPARLRTPFAVFLHGVEAWRPLRPAERVAGREATLRIANSRFTASAATAANPGLGDIVVCQPSLPKGTVLPDSRAPSHEGRLVVLIVGRLASGERYKGHDQLVRIWPAVVKQIPNAELVIVGDGDDAERLRRLTSECGANGSVRFAGFLTRQALEDEYARAALFAMPSRGEGFGLVYLEAMAHGLACIGSGRDAASEVIEDGTTGVLVNPEDEGTLARTIVALLESPARRRSMGEAGRVRVARSYQYDRFRREVASALEQAFGGQRRAV